jgi:hypothetical protein
MYKQERINYHQISACKQYDTSITHGTCDTMRAIDVSLSIEKRMALITQPGKEYNHFQYICTGNQWASICDTPGAVNG